MRHKATTAALLAAGLCCVLSSAACSGDEPRAGGLLIVIDSDLSIPKDIDHVSLDVTQLGQSLMHEYKSIGKGELLIPAQFQLSPTGKASEPVLVRAVAYRDGVPTIERSSVTQVPAEHVGLLRLPLKYLCEDTAHPDGSSTCGEGQTCILGSCRSAEVAASSLQNLGRSTFALTAADAGMAGCYDALACMLEAETAELDRDACTLKQPDGVDAARLNVALVLPHGSAGICDEQLCYVALDRDVDWSVRGDLIQLPTSLCQKLEGRPFEVRTSTACAAKRSNIPLCGNWSPVTTPLESPIGHACIDADRRRCGTCGWQSRLCHDGHWSAFGLCESDAECLPGTTRSCGRDGKQTCGTDCTWEGACLSQRCVGADTQRCGFCDLGTQTRSCDSQTGEWSDWSSCEGGAECAPRQTRDCGVQGKQLCGDDCRWSAECSGQQCLPAGPSSQACGLCGLGLQTRTCDARNGEWSAWSSCTGGGACEPGSTRACGAGGRQVCGGDCQWPLDCPGQICNGPSSQSCGFCNQGMQSRSCDPRTGTWSSWSSCIGGGACQPLATQTCGSQGRQVCGDDCKWSAECTGQICLPEGPASRACGNCGLGTQTRTCDTRTAKWSDWSTCAGGGACTPGEVRACGEGSTQTCSSSCTWGACPCPGSSTQACGRCGVQTRTCNNGTWSGWSACSRPAPVGAAAGGYDFDALGDEGWTIAGPFDGTSSTPIPDAGLGDTLYWDDECQEGVGFHSDEYGNSKGALIPLAIEGTVTVTAPSGRWRLELSSPMLSDQSPFQNHSLVSFALLHIDNELPLWAEALLAVEKCDGTRGLVKRASTDDSGLCQPPPGKWTTCQFILPLTGVQRVERVLIRVYYASKAAYGFTPVLDSVHAQ